MSWGTLVAGLFSSYQQSQAAEAQAEAQQDRAEYRAKVLRRNRELKMRDAESIEARGEFEEQTFRKGIQQTIGAVRARSAASGFAVDEGAGAEAQGDIAFAGEMDILNLRDQYEQRSRAVRIEGSFLEERAGLSGLEAESIDPDAIGTSTFLSGATSTVARETERGTFR